MNAEMLTLPGLLFSAADTYMLFRFFKAMFPCRARREGAMPAFLGMTALTFLGRAVGTPWAGLTVLPMLCLLFVLLLFHLSLCVGIVYTLVFYSIFAGGGIVCKIIRQFLCTNLAVPITGRHSGTDMLFLLADCIFRFLVLLWVEKFIVKLESGRQQGFPWRLLIMPVSSMMILCGLLRMELPGEAAARGLMCGGALLLYFSNAAIFVVLERYTAVVGRLENGELLKIKQTMEDNHVQNIAALNESYRSYMHDIHHYFSNIRMLAIDGQTQSIVKIIDEIEGSMQGETDSRIYSGNPVLNAILTERRTRARQLGIDMDIFVENFLKVDFISEADMVSMFGNLLDNAIEAAERCGEGRRLVKVRLFMGNQYMLVLHMENSYETIVRKNSGELLTTKEKSAGHGLGIGIVRKLAQKYGGTLNLEERDGMFRTILAISASKPD